MKNKKELFKIIEDLKRAIEINELKLRKFDAMEFENAILKSEKSHSNIVNGLIDEIFKMKTEISVSYAQNNQLYSKYEEFRIENRHLEAKVKKLLEKQDGHLKRIVELEKENKLLHLKLENIRLRGKINERKKRNEM